METLLRQRDAARLLGVSVRSLERWRCSGTVDLPYVKLGGVIRYQLENIQRLIASRTIRNTSEENGNGKAND
jgi:predicted site-specific integrase-resolvase